MLAKVTFGQDPLSESGIGLGTLQVWFTSGPHGVMLTSAVPQIGAGMNAFVI